MSLTKKIHDKIHDMLTSPIPVWMRMRMDELERGHVIIQPGTVPWLPVEEGHDTDCVSIADGEVRLVAIWAKYPGTGAFRRLVEGILDCGLVPVVVAPLDHMVAILVAWGWQHSYVGNSFEDWEDQWRPPEDWT